MVCTRGLSFERENVFGGGEHFPPGPFILPSAEARGREIKKDFVKSNSISLMPIIQILLNVCTALHFCVRAVLVVVVVYENLRQDETNKDRWRQVRLAREKGNIYL